MVLEAEFVGAGTDAWGKERGGFSASTTVDRKKWDINFNKTLDKGGALLGDEVTITLEISALLETEAAEE